jgi:hypothetical protein
VVDEEWRGDEEEKESGSGGDYSIKVWHVSEKKKPRPKYIHL